MASGSDLVKQINNMASLNQAMEKADRSCNKLATRFNDLAKASKKLSKSMKGTLSKLSAGTDQTMRKVADSADGSMNNIGATLEKTAEKFSNSVGSVVSDVSSKLSKGLAKVADETEAAGVQAEESASKTSALEKAQANLGTAMQFIGDSIGVANERLEIERELQGALGDTSGIQKYAKELQKAGVVSDESLLVGANQIASAKLQASTVQQLLPGLADLAAAQGGVGASADDASVAGGALGDAMSGNLDSIKAMGIEFSEAQEQIMLTGEESAKAAVLQDALAKGVGGMNAELGNTNAGNMAQVTNTFQELKEGVGMSLMPVLTTFTGFISDRMPAIQETIQNVFGKVGQVFGDVAATIESSGILTIAGEIFDTLAEFSGLVFTSLIGDVDGLGGAFETIAPIVSGLLENGLNGVKTVVGWMKDNMGLVTPLLWGLIGAFTAYQVITLASAVAQTGLNLALSLSPLGWVALAIGGLVAVGVLLYQNWDTIKEKAMGLWEGLKGAFGQVGEFFSGIFEGIKDTLKGAINFMIGGVNTLIKGINSLSFKMPDWVPGMGGKSIGISIPVIPEFALGTAYSPEGFARIHEKGGEIRHLSSGEMIIPADKSRQLISNSKGQNTINININGVSKSTDEIVGELVPQLRLALSNI